jgi:peptidoglycan/LPS O-acetylase OafA/YrhL
LIGGLHRTNLTSAWQRDLFFGVPAAFIVLGSVAMENRGSTAPRWLIAAGDASYSLYLSQGLILAAISRTAWKILPDGAASNALIATVMAVAAIIGGFCCYHLLELPLIGMTKKLLEGKKESALPQKPDAPVNGVADFSPIKSATAEATAGGAKPMN